MDEFAYCTPGTKAGVLHMRELTDNVLRTIARDGDHVTPEFREVYAFMETVKDGNRPTNPMWVTGEAIDELFRRNLIDGEQSDHMRREAGL